MKLQVLEDYYKRLMREIKKVVDSKTIFINLPIPIFGFLLQIWSLISGNPALQNHN